MPTQQLCVRHTYLAGRDPATIVGPEDCDVCKATP